MNRFDKVERSPRAVFFAFVVPALLVFWSGFASPGFAADDEGFGYTYEAVLEAPDLPADVAALLKASATTFTGVDEPPAGPGRLERRALEDIPVMQRALRSEGFFKAEVEVETAFDERPARVRFTVAPGPPFVLEDIGYSIVGRDDDKPIDTPGPRRIGLKYEDRFRAEELLDAEDLIERFFRENSRPFARVKKRQVQVDHETLDVRVAWTIDIGPEAVYGEIDVQGLSSVDEDFVRTYYLWSPGQPYSISDLDDARNEALKSGLFSRVDFESPQGLTDEGRLPIIATFQEREFKTIELGLEYTSDFGIGATAGWSHRNILGAGERLSFDVSANAFIQEAQGVFRKPLFYHPDQSLVVRSVLSNEDTEAFEGISFDNSAVVERAVLDSLTLSGGVGWRFSRVRDEDDELGGMEDEKRTFGLLYLPLTGVYDRRDDVLDPTEGLLVTLAAAPYADTLGEDINFIRYRLEASTYYGIGYNNWLTPALRVAFGQISGADRDSVPADLRFYAGGGRSVRGYGFQDASPLNADNDPIGGLSLLEGSLEARIKATDRFGVVPFVDFGRAFEEPIPDFEEQIFIGAGIGFRYYSDFGPLRLDVGVPLNRREGVDEPVQIYLSIGQAF